MKSRRLAERRAVSHFEAAFLASTAGAVIVLRPSRGDASSEDVKGRTASDERKLIARRVRFSSWGV